MFFIILFRLVAYETKTPQKHFSIRLQIIDVPAFDIFKNISAFEDEVRSELYFYLLKPKALVLYVLFYTL